MYSKLLTLPLLAISLTLFTACGGGGSDSSPQVIMSSIPDNYKVVKTKPTLELDGTMSSDNGVIKSYSWTIDDVVVSNKAKDTIDLNLALGSHKICLTLVDDESKTTTQCKNIEVIEPTLGKPTAVINIINHPSDIKTACPITVSASESRADKDGNIIKYEWFKNAQPFGNNEATQKFESNSTGDVNITVKVTDNEYNTNSITEIINILPHTNPTVKLRMIDPIQRTVFSLETNQANNIIEPQDSDKNQPYQGSLVFLSVAGSYDDCNVTDDNLTYIWDGRIFQSDTGITAKSNCFSANPHLQYYHRDFNTTGEVESQVFSEKQPSTEPNFSYIIDKNKFDSAKYIYPYVDRGPYNDTYDDQGNLVSLDPNRFIGKGEGGPYVYIQLCAGEHFTFDRLEIELTVIDNLHGTQTYIKRTVAIRPDDSNNSN